MPLIFVVDNNPLFRRITVQYLNIADYGDILTFSDADECLEYIDLQPDIVVTEFYYGEGKINGIGLLERIKTLSPKTKVIFMSSLVDMESAIHTVRLGAVDFIVKNKMALDKLILRIMQLSSYKREIKRVNSVSITLAASLLILIVIFISLIFLYARH